MSQFIKLCTSNTYSLLYVNYISKFFKGILIKEVYYLQLTYILSPFPKQLSYLLAIPKLLLEIVWSKGMNE